MSHDYVVSIKIGTAFIRAVTRGDAARLPDVLDGLTFGWSMPDTAEWPAQPDAMTASFSIIARSAADVAAIELGDPVFLHAAPYDWVWEGIGAPIGAFSGRVAELAGHAVKCGDPDTGQVIDAWVLDIRCVGYLADLAETDVTGLVDQGLSPYGRLNQAADLAEIPRLEWSTGGGGAVLLTLNEGLPSASFLEYATTILRAYADGGPFFGTVNQDRNVNNHPLYAAEGWRRGVLAPQVALATGDLDPVKPFRVDWISRRNPSTAAETTLPGLFRPGPNGWRVDMVKPTAPGTDRTTILPGRYIDRGSTWTRTKWNEPNVVIITQAKYTSPGLDPPDQDWRRWRVTNRLPGQARIAVKIENTELQHLHNAERVGVMYLDDSGNGSRVWAADTFTYYASEDPGFLDQLVPLFPDTSGWRGHSQPVVVTGLPATQSPVGRTWSVGVLQAAALAFSGGRFSVLFTLTPRTPSPASVAGSNALRWSDVTGAPRWVDVDPAVTWIDLRLARRP